MLEQYLPSYYRKSKVMHDIFTAFEAELSHAMAELQATEDAFFALRTDRYIDRALDDVGQSAGADSLQVKRELLLAQLQGIGTVTQSYFKEIVYQYVGGQIDLIESPETASIAIRFVNKKGMPPELDELKEVLEAIKPAHLAVEYLFTYRIWQDVYNVLNDWLAAKAYTWGELLTFEVEYNLLIYEGGLYYCPDGYGNAILVWKNNKPYAREVS